MTDTPAMPAADEAARRDEALSSACVDEYLHEPEVGPLAGAAPLGHPCVAQPEQWWPNPGEDPVASFGGVSVSDRATPAVDDVSFPVPRGSIVALIGPSGSGKSTLLRCLNRMNDLVPGCRVEGDVRYRGIDLYAPEVDPVAVRTRIGLVFQRPNPFPKSIYDNVAFGPRTHGFHGDLDDIVERALRRAALCDEVKTRLGERALALSGGQQQRLVIARALAVEPDILLMDEPASALDPISTSRIEDLMRELTPDVTIVIVTHNLQQAARIADLTAFLTSEPHGDGSLVGRLVEFGTTEQIFANPADERTAAYVSGRFG
ncbi:MAG TPA: phosphate ABC transporter ATP-binding protein [Jatrophihabitantaceae bacterium]|nr:phosphate ABC transporter ATP-binding protein [Jatrophihabitantaceae bacterium]